MKFLQKIPDQYWDCMDYFKSSSANRSWYVQKTIVDAYPTLNLAKYKQLLF
jgi:hypothetical protein